MIILGEDRVVKTPNKQIPLTDYLYLWHNWDNEYNLVIEDWQFRIYDFELWSEDSINDNYENESWRDYVSRWFEWANECLDRDTLRCQPLDFSWKNTFEITDEILEFVDKYMTDDINGGLYLDLENRVPSETLINFIGYGLSKIGERVYCYYK